MPLLCRLRLWIGAVPLCGVVFIESGRDCVRGRIDRRGRRAAGGNVESVQKEGGDGRTDGAMSLYSPACRRSLSFSPSYFMKAEGFSAKMCLRLVLGPLLRFCHMMAEQYSNDESLFYDTRILNLDFDTKLRISVDGQAHNCPLPSHSLSS